MECPVCNGEMWDNRNRKKNPKSPDFKCKNKECGKAIWTTPKPNGQPPRASGTAAAYSWGDLGRTYARCVDIAKKAWPVAGNAPHVGGELVAAAATVFIQATKLGLKVEGPKPPPPPPPPPPPEDDYERDNDYVDEPF